MGLVRLGGERDRRVSRASGRVGNASEGGARGESPCRGGACLNLLAKQQGADALRRLPPTGPADHVELRGERGETNQLSRQGHREILERSRCRATLATSRRLPQRRQHHGSLLETWGSQRDRAKSLSLCLMIQTMYCTR